MADPMNDVLSNTANVGDMLYCVAKQIRQAEARQAITDSLASAQESATVKPTHCATKRVETLEQEAFVLFRNVLHVFRANELMISFNGGKDCTVLLHLLHTFFGRNKCISHIRIPVLYIETDDTFDEIESMVLECERLYNINLLRRKGCIKVALKGVLEEFPEIKGVFMGSRRTDPYCERMTVMQPTDPDWPQLMRINPLLDWNYIDVWYYIFVRKVPYCALYEQGYTSLGQRSNTLPNPYLRIICPRTGKVTYKHAAELTEAKYERAGRTPADFVQNCIKDDAEKNEGEENQN